MLDLIGIVNEASAEELPAVAAALEAARVRLQQRLLTATPTNGTGTGHGPVSERFIAAEQAATIAGLPMVTDADRKRSSKRVYAWAHGRKWASNPTGRMLLIAEQPFRAWLRTRHP